MEGKASRGDAVICLCRHRPAPGEVIYVVHAWSTNAVGHRWGAFLRVHHERRPGKCAHAAVQHWADIDAMQARDNQDGLTVTERG